MMIIRSNRAGTRNPSCSGLRERHTILALVLIFCCSLPGWAQQFIDWQGRIRELVAQQRIDQALMVSEQWLGAVPQDLEARGWHARLLAWSNRWSEAETEYREVLKSAPGDNDILLGLADVLTWQKRTNEA